VESKIRQFADTEIRELSFGGETLQGNSRILSPIRPNSAKMPSSLRQRSTPELSTVRFGTMVLKYQLRRTQRQKTVSIAVEPDAGIVVTAPAQATEKRIEEIVRQKGPWI
jgi:hypothetical protein